MPPRRGRSLLARLAEGEAVALVSDAGTPLISDPGYKLVRAAQRGRPHVTAIPGASSVLAALSVAGLPTDRFFFEGFLPPKQAARQKRIAALSAIPATLVLFESGQRLAAALADLADGLGRARGRGLPRADQAARGSAPRRSGDARARLRARRRDARRDRHRGGAAGGRRSEAVDVDALLRGALARVSLKDAVGEVALASGRPRREVYRRALELSKDAGDGAAH